MKKRILAAAVIAMMLSLLSYGTLAYFTTEGTAHNVITTGEVNIALTQRADQSSPAPAAGAIKIMPGSSVTKIAEVKNTGSGIAWIRARIDIDFQLAPGADGTADPNMITLDLDRTKWITGDDGYYYYSDRLAPGDTTVPLFTSIGFDPTMGDLYQDGSAKVDVHVYAVQSANNGSSVIEAAGWPEP